MTQSRRPSSQNRPRVSRPGSTGLRFGMFAVCVTRDPDPGLNSGKAKPLYDLLVTFADVSSRDTEKGYPYREALAVCLDCSKQTVDRAADYLETEIGLVTVHRRKVEGKPDENDANLYEIHDAWLIHGVTPPTGTPPQLVARYGHTVPGLDVEAWIGEHVPAFDLPAWRAAYDERLRAQEAKREEQRRKERARRKKPKKGGGVTRDATPGGAEERGGSVMGDATGGVTGDASGGVMGDALSKAGGPEPSSTDDDAPSGRSPAGARSASTSGSSAREAEGGSAASGNNQPTPTPEQQPHPKTGGKAKHSKQQLDLVRTVRAHFPADFLAAPLPDLPFLSQAILDALDGDVPAADRTVEQLGARIEQRWNHHGWAEKFYRGEIDSLVGAAVAMVRPLKSTDRYGCGNPRCEAGVDVDTGVPCHVCPERLAARRANRREGGEKVPGPRSDAAGPTRWECEAPTCRDVVKGPRSTTGLCPGCDAELERATAMLMASGPVAESGPGPEYAPSAEGPEGDGVDEETARLRAFYARQYGTPDQVAAYCGSVDGGSYGLPPF